MLPKADLREMCFEGMFSNLFLTRGGAVETISALLKAARTGLRGLKGAGLRAVFERGLTPNSIAILPPH